MIRPDAADVASLRAPIQRATASAWDAYWERLPCRHAFFAAEAARYVEELGRVFPLARDWRVLDFGCGVGLVGASLARRVASVALWDASPAMRRRASAHVAGVANALLVDLGSGRSPLPGPFDLVLVNSVAQYMAFDELCAWLPCWREMLAPAGRVVLSDVLPVRARRGELARELAQTLAWQARHGLLVHALAARVADMPSYTRARRAAPLLRIDPEKLAWAARPCGLDVEALPRSLTCHAGRLTLVLSAR